MLIGIRLSNVQTTPSWPSIIMMRNMHIDTMRDIDIDPKEGIKISKHTAANTRKVRTIYRISFHCRKKCDKFSHMPFTITEDHFLDFGNNENANVPGSHLVRATLSLKSVYVWISRPSPAVFCPSHPPPPYRLHDRAITRRRKAAR